MLKLGTTSINKLYVGSTEINKAYLGSTLVYDNTVSTSAPVLDSAVRSGSDYILTFSQPANTLAPDGGYDTFINNVDQNDSASYTGFTRTITGLDTTIDQTFKLESRYVALGVFPQSNEITVQGETVTSTGVFPEAKGFGSEWTFTSDYEVRVVTNLNNSGTGSLRTAVTTSTTYDGVIVVFNGLSGIINLDSSLVINIGNKHLYIAGQTSENGIFIKNSTSFSSAYLFSLQNDYTIIRGIGIGNNYSGTTDTVHIYDTQNVVLDRCTILWGTDETFDVFGYWNAAANPELSNSQKTTVQNCIIGEPLNPSHRLNTLVYATDELSFYQNLFIHSGGRVPLIEADGLKIELVRNIGYNNEIGQTYFQSYANTAEHTDVYYTAINNYEKTGSDSNGGAANAIRVMVELDSQTTSPVIYTYSKGNINPSRLLATNGEYDAIRTYGGTSPYTFPSAQQITDWETRKTGYPLADMADNIITHTALETLLTGTGGVGTFTRNNTETRLVNDVINSTGAFTNTGVAPTISAGTIITDTDNDGIPDSEEATWGNDTFGYVNSLV